MLAGLFSIVDYDVDWFVENCASVATGESGEEVGQILRVWSCSPVTPHVHICHDSTLASLYLVRHRQCGTTHARSKLISN